MNKVVKILMLLAVLASAGVDDIREKVKDCNDADATSYEIIIGKSIFGISKNATENQVIKLKSKPDGYIRINSELSGMIYGNNIMFLFKNGKLKGVRTTHGIIDWRIGNMINLRGTPEINWTISNGISNTIPIEKLKELYKTSVVAQEWQLYFEDENVKIDFDISRSTDMKGVETQSISGMLYLEKN